MATKIKGITIELSADASGLEQALKQVNKSLSETQKDLKAVDKALALDPKNLDLIEQKQRLMAKAVADTTKKVEALKEAQASLKDVNTEQGQRQYDALTREIATTESKLKELNREQQEFEKQASSAKGSASGFAGALGTVSEVADKVAQKTAAISAAAATALGGLGMMVVSASNFADEMLTMSQQTGLSTTALQEMKYAAERIDVPLETITGSIEKMKGKLDESSDTWRRLGVDVKDQAGQYRDIESIFYDTVSALSEIENETERDTVAMDIFGRSASDLTGIIDDGGAKMRALGQEAQGLNLVIPQSDLESLGQFNDLLEQMKSQLQFAAVSAAVPILESMAPVVQKVAEGIRAFAQVLANLDPRLVKFVTITLLIVASISPMAKAVSALTSGFSGFLKVLPYTITGLEMLNAAFMQFATNPTVIMVVAIVAALAALAAVIYLVVDNWEYVEPAAQEACDAMSNGIQSVMNTIRGFGESIQSGITSAIEKAKDSFMGIGEGAKSAFGGVVDMVLSVGDAFDSLVDKISSTIQGIVQVFDDIKREARKAGSDVINNFVGGVKAVIAQVTQAFQNMAASIKAVFKGIEADAKSSGKAAGSAYYSGMSSAPRPSFSYLTPTPAGGGGYGGSTPYGLLGSPGGSELLGAIDTLNYNIEHLGSSPTNVNVTLSGSAKNIFDTVRVQNSKLQTATGYHALA